MARRGSLVSAQWLKSAMVSSSKNVCVVDATYFLPNSPFSGPEGSAPLAEFQKAHIPGARFVDIDEYSEEGYSAAPHNLPDLPTFLRLMAELSVDKDTELVAYDQHGLFSSPRMWFTMRAYGHPARVAVLDGGLPAWKACGFDTHSAEQTESTSDFTASGVWSKDQAMQWNLGAMKQWSNSDIAEKGKVQVVDARATGRFTGESPEPRAGLRGGHIPDSVNVPFGSLLTDTGEMKPTEELEAIFDAAGVDFRNQSDKRIVASCGSGLTACVVGLALNQVGFPHERFIVYDGSWTEWGAQDDTDIIKGP